MMKKKTALVLTLAMVFSLAPLSAYAETITTGGGAASHDVTATYRADSSGGAGGTVVACGTPEQVAACPESYTGQYLKKLL